MPTDSTFWPGKMAVLKKARGPRLLTPHPGEMKRLFPKRELARAELARTVLRKVSGHFAPGKGVARLWPKPDGL
jgi:hypothetical protein